MNKRIFFILTLLLMCSSGFCQIGTTDVATPIHKKEITIFDSTRNYWGGENVFSYTGQLLFVLPIEGEVLQKYGYERFKPVNYNPNTNRFAHYGENAEFSQYNTKYEILAEKYFFVDSVNILDNIQYIFYLTEKDNNSNRCCFIYNSQYEHTFPFIVVSHYNYLKKKYIGQDVIVHKKFLSEFDIKTGLPINVNDDTKTYWKVKDITILNDEYRHFVLILENGSQTTTFWVKRLNFPDKSKALYLKSDWTKLCSRYGAAMMKTALHQQIMVGMPRELLINSWGEPDRINSASYGDQYIYGDDCVYLRNGKVTSWN